MYRFLWRHAQHLVGVMEQPQVRLVGTGLLRGDHGIERKSQAGQAARDQIVVGVGDRRESPTARSQGRTCERSGAAP
jgi:hypothetical protein